MTPLDARILESDRLEHGQWAEGQGLRASRVFDRPFKFTKDPYQQARFEQGFRDGKTLREVTHASADCGASDETAAAGLRVGEPDDPAVRNATGQPSPYSA